MFNKKIVEQKIEYMNNNPLSKKWNLVSKPEDYKFSSAKFYLQNIDDWGFIKHYSEDCWLSGENDKGLIIVKYIS